VAWAARHVLLVAPCYIKYRASLDLTNLFQVEHYFGDYNLPKDKFLLEQTKLDDGWIPMATMLKFKRLSSLSDDAKTIMEVVKTSEKGLMEVDLEKEKIRRLPSQALPEWNDERRAELAKQTVYVKGFDKVKSTLDELIKFFEERCENVLNVQMRTYVDKKAKDKDGARGFKGSVFVTFKDKENAEKLMALETFKIGEEEAVRKWQEEYNADKAKEFEDRKKQKKGDKAVMKKAKEGGDADDKEEEKEKVC
jgi:lupus La protein